MFLSKTTTVRALSTQWKVFANSFHRICWFILLLFGCKDGTGLTSSKSSIGSSRLWENIQPMVSKGQGLFSIIKRHFFAFSVWIRICFFSLQSRIKVLPHQLHLKVFFMIRIPYKSFFTNCTLFLEHICGIILQGIIWIG